MNGKQDLLAYIVDGLGVRQSLAEDAFYIRCHLSQKLVVIFTITGLTADE